MGEEIFVDANIFLEIFLKDSNSEECKKFLKSLQEQNMIAVTNDFIIYSCLINVQNNLKNIEAIKNVITFFNNLHSLIVLRPSFDELHEAVEIMKNNKLDFDDSLVVACMKSYSIRQIATFDKHFDKVKGIERVKL